MKVTSIVQLFPAASVLPQDLEPVTCPKSPLVVMVLMFRVVVPVLRRVTALLPEVPPTTSLPHAKDVGVTVTVGPVPIPCTVRLSVVVFVSAPEVPVIVTATVPWAAVELAVKVSVLVDVVGFGLNAAVTPLGKPDAARVTLPVNPPSALTVMVLVALVP